MSKKEFRYIYRSLFKLTSKFDKFPESKCLIFRKFLNNHNDRFESPSAEYFSYLVENFLPKKNFYFGSSPYKLSNLVSIIYMFTSLKYH